MTNDKDTEAPVLDQYGQPIPKWVNIPEKSRQLTKPMIEQLLKPFPPEALETINYGAKLTTIKAMYIIERLNEVFGYGRWVHHHTIIKSDTKETIALGRLEILDYDVVVPEQYGGMRGGSADSYKGAVTNSLSKCASYLGVGIDVFKGQKEKAPAKPKPQDEAEQIVTKIKSELNKMQPNMNGQTALKLFRDKTGLNWTSFNNITLAQAKAGYANLISNK